jgi:hypothetical protein
VRRYVTYLITYLGDKLPKFYIGSTYEERALSGKYFGSVSSKRYKEIFLIEKRDNPHLFSLEILSYHEDREAALSEELKIQLELNVVKSNEYMNESFAKVNGFFGRDTSGENHPQYGNTLSEETKNKISNTLTGRIEPEETRRKKSESKLGDKNSFYGKKHSNETKDRISKTKQGTTSWNKGIPMSEESKKKLSESKKGKKASEETKKKLSEMKKGKPKSLETKEKMRLAWISTLKMSAERRKKKEQTNENN